MANVQERQNTQVSPVNQMRHLLNYPGMQNLFANALNANKDRFIASLIDLYNGDTYLQQCDPKEVAMEALKAATLNLPINKSLGYAYIVPYKDKSGKQVPQLQIGYKGYIQMAQRSGQYRALNAGMIYEGMEIKQNYLKGTFEILGEPVSDKIIGYFAYFELLNGYEKALYMTKDEIKEHASRYSRSYGKKYTPWEKEFDAMAQKTVLRRLLTKYGVLSSDFENMEKAEEDQAVVQVQENNAAVDMPAIETDDEVVDVDPETGEVLRDEDVKAPF